MHTPTDPERPTSVGERLRRARQTAGVTQMQLAGTEFTLGYIKAIENGKTLPSLRTLNILAARLGKPPGSLTEGLPPKEVAPRYPPDFSENELVKLFKQCSEAEKELIQSFVQWIIAQRKPIDPIEAPLPGHEQEQFES